MDRSVTDAELAALAAYLSQFVTPHKLSLMDAVLAQRTRYLTVVLEDIDKPYNAAAVLRTCDGFGVQDVHVIQNVRHLYFSNHVTQGAERWVTTHFYREPDGHNTAHCYAALREQGYRIAATSLRPGSVPLHELDLAQPTALVFGLEESGLSDEAHDSADIHITIPMFGFTQSFNLSVSAAICLYELTRQLHATAIDWRLDSATRTAIKVTWLQERIQGGDALARRYLAGDSS
ncbi:MAG: RNA methyltransferase [Anaerolineae bacterium]|nr:RNA methyltransferase [Anaerolineae bacterium]MCO5190507.1 RNA methyltransferase [Anaerolineae bacterium]MCO5193380.1 RNA methyltransferase [Anaerolineae bacterium]